MSKCILLKLDLIVIAVNTLGLKASKDLVLYSH